MWAIHAWHVRTLKDRGNRMRIEWGEQDNRIRGRNTSVGSVRLRIVALASVGCLMSNTTALALRTGYTMYSTNKSSPYSGLLVAMSKCVIWMRYMSNDPVTQWPVRFRQYCPYHDSDYVWASQSSTGSELKRIRDQILILPHSSWSDWSTRTEVKFSLVIVAND